MVPFLVAACAHVEAPRGGPEILGPLTLVDVAPDSMAVVPAQRGPVVFEFERTLSERGLDDAVLVSPRTSSVAVGHRGRVLRIGLRGGWEPGRIYQITITPTIQDRWNNRLAQTVTHIFSTGPEIPDTRLDGRARDRITGNPEVDIRVEAIRAADSLVYATRTDSAGVFVFRHVPEGDYLVRAYRDVNRNRQLDAFEARDTAFATITTDETPRVRLSVVMPDTTPPVARTAQATEFGVEVEFDDYLDPLQELGTDQVRITGPDGVAVPVARLGVGRLPGEENGVEEQEPPPAVPAAPAAPAPGRGPGPGAAPPPEGPLPSRRLLIETAVPLAPATEYRVEVEGVRNLVDLVGGGEAQFTTPDAPPEPEPEAEPPPETPDTPDAPPAPEPDAAPAPAPPPGSIAVHLFREDQS